MNLVFGILTGLFIGFIINIIAQIFMVLIAIRKSGHYREEIIDALVEGRFVFPFVANRFRNPNESTDA